MLCAARAAGAEEPESHAALASIDVALDVLPQHPLTGRSLANESSLARSIYARTRSLLWSRQGQLSAQTLELVQLLNSAESFGLQPSDYAIAELSDLLEARDHSSEFADSARLDLWLTLAAARFLSHLHYGRIDPRAVGFELSGPRNDLDIVSAVIALSAANNVAKFVAQVEPHFYHYALLKSALARYRQLALDPTMTHLPALKTQIVHRDDLYEESQALRKLLLAEGDLPSSAITDIAAGQRFDMPLSEALQRFQARHGLPASGNLDRITWTALTTPFSARVRQIELTLERWRWLPEFSTPPIIVNIPQFRLFAFTTTADRAASILQIPVIVGQTYPGKRTPVFVGDLKYVIFRPYWDVPRSIAMREMLPELRRHPKYLQRNHLELVRGEGDNGAIVPPSAAAIAELAAGRLRLRQQPGDDNALGLIKFLFPNTHNVYLHSTPAHRLFLASRRAFSHGCIRVADPVALAALVLKNTSTPWDTARIEAAMHGTSTLRVDLIEPIHVLILYGTAMATEAGPIQFFEDIYGHDRQLAALLDLP